MAGPIIAFVSMVLLLAGIGFSVLALFGMRPGRAVVLGAPVGVGAVGIAATVCATFDLGWNWVVPVVLLAVLFPAALIKYAVGRVWLSAGPYQWEPFVAGVVGVVAFAGLYLHTSLGVAGSLEAMPYFGDSAFHLQATQLIAATGDVAPFGGLSPLYDPVGSYSVYYPTLWHSLSVLAVPAVGVVAATNVLMLIVAVVLWPVGLAVLAWVVKPSATWAPMLAPLTATFVVIFPLILDTAYSIYPFSLSVAIFPGTVALFLLWRRESKVAPLVGWLFGVIGMVLAQPSTALLFLVVVACSYLVDLFWTQTEWVRHGKAWLTALTAFALLAAVSAAVLVLPRWSFVANLGRFERPSLGYNAAIVQALNGTTAVTYPWHAWWVIVFAAVAGAAVTMRSRLEQSVLLSTLCFGALYVVAAGPDSLLRVLTGPFYKDFQRLSVFMLMFVLVLASVGVATAVRYLSDRIDVGPQWARSTVAGAVLLGGCGLMYSSQEDLVGRVASDYVRLGYELSDSQGLNRDAVSLLEVLGDIDTPEGARIIGLPSSGVPFSSVISGVQSYVPVSWPVSEDQQYIGENFRYIGEDPEVCRILDEGDVVFYLEVPLGGGAEREELQYLGFVDVPTDEGFELVAAKENAKLWRITACD